MQSAEAGHIPIGSDFPGRFVVPDGRKAFATRVAKAWVKLRILPDNEIRNVPIKEFRGYRKIAERKRLELPVELFNRQFKGSSTVQIFETSNGIVILQVRGETVWTSSDGEL